MENNKKVKVAHNDEMGFLYKSTTISPIAISQIASVPEFMDALRAYKGHLGNKEVYEVLRNTYKKMLSDGNGHRTARNIMKIVSRDVTGDSQTWRTD